MTLLSSPIERERERDFCRENVSPNESCTLEKKHRNLLIFQGFTLPVLQLYTFPPAKKPLGLLLVGCRQLQASLKVEPKNAPTIIYWYGQKGIWKLHNDIMVGFGNEPYRLDSERMLRKLGFSDDIPRFHPTKTESNR